MLILLAVILSIAAVTAPAPAAETVRLTIPALPDGSEGYYRALIEQALKDAGYAPEIQGVAVRPADLDHLDTLLDDNRISLAWFAPAKAYDQRWARVPVGLTNGLMGLKVLIIPKGDQAAYDAVKTLDDLRNLKKTAAIPLFSGDAVTWKTNKLPFKQPWGDSRKAYDLVARDDGGYDYVAVAFTDFRREASNFEGRLVVEQRLILASDRDLIIYLSPGAACHRDLLLAALTQARQTGLMDTLLGTYYAEGFARLQPGKRVVIKLKNPD